MLEFWQGQKHVSPLWSDMVFLIEVRFDQKHVHGQERPSESLDRPSSLVAFTSLPCLPREKLSERLSWLSPSTHSTSGHTQTCARPDFTHNRPPPGSGIIDPRDALLFRDASTTIVQSIKQPCESQSINLPLLFSNTCNHTAASSVEISPTREIEKANTARAARVPRFGKTRNRRN